jgi:DNA-binding winged helix-turn-helix (wHTH) protein
MSCLHGGSVGTCRQFSVDSMLDEAAIAGLMKRGGIPAESTMNVYSFASARPHAHDNKAAVISPGADVVTGPDGTFRLGPWTVRPRLGQIAGPGGERHLEPKVMGVLTCLAEHAGDVVTRDELVERVWEGRMVSDEVVSRCISQLRTRLGDTPREPEYIRTVPKIGYQLLKAVTWDEAPPAIDDPTEPAPVAAPTAAKPPTRVEPRAPPRSRLPWGVLVVAIAALTVVLLMRGNEDPGVEEDATRPALAVLPFTTLGDDPQNDYLGDGLTEDLINHLANLPGLQVVASTSAFGFKDRAADVRDIARELGVRHVLQGSVR